MASSGLQILVSVLLLCFVVVQVDCKVESYALNFVEEGTPVREEVDVDVENGTEVIKVPGHNDKEPMEVMNDFVAGLTARRLPSTQECYVSKLDPTLPAPQKLKLDMDQASKQPLSGGVTIKETTTRVLGFANRLKLPQRISDFCGSFPIYNVEEMPLDIINASLYKTEGQGRTKRQQQFPTACSTSDASRLQNCLSNTGYNYLRTSCRFNGGNCYFIITCKLTFFSGLTCSYSRHVFSKTCCSFSC